MAYTILRNTINTTVLHFDATTSIVITGNSAVSNITSNSSEVVISATLGRAWYGSQGGIWKIERGSSSANAVVAVFNNTGEYTTGPSIGVQNAGANIFVTLNGTGNGFLVVELHKVSSF